MKFVEKLATLTEGQNKAKIARKAGLPSNAINDYIKKGYTPRVDNALALARSLGVPFEWLFDDDRDFPVPLLSETHLRAVSDEVLMLEVAHRQRREMVLLLQALDRADKIDWENLHKALDQIPAGEPIPKLREVRDIIWGFRVFPYRVQRYDPIVFARAHHESLAGRERPAADFVSVLQRYQAFGKKPGFNEVYKRITSEMDAERERFVERLIAAGALVPLDQDGKSAD